MRADAFIRLKRYPEAIRDLDHAILINPDLANLFAYRATAHEALGHREQAINDFRAALKREPNLRYAQDALRRILESP